jgi:curved DNA-binding protein CbpA
MVIDGDAASKFIIVQDAFAVLSDPDKRRVYDRVTARRRTSTSNAPSPSQSPSWWNIWQHEAFFSRDMRPDAEYSSTLRETLEGLAAEIRNMSLAALAFFLTVFGIFLSCAAPLLIIVLIITLSLSICSTIMKAVATNIAHRRARIAARFTSQRKPSSSISSSSSSKSGARASST